MDEMRITLHKDLEEKVFEGLERSDFHVYAVDIIYPIDDPVFLEVTLFEKGTMQLHYVDVPCTRLERMVWGVEDDVYAGCEI